MPARYTIGSQQPQNQRLYRLLRLHRYRSHSDESKRFGFGGSELRFTRSRFSLNSGAARHYQRASRKGSSTSFTVLYMQGLINAIRSNQLIPALILNYEILTRPLCQGPFEQTRVIR